MYSNKIHTNKQTNKPNKTRHRTNNKDESEGLALVEIPNNLIYRSVSIKRPQGIYSYLYSYFSHKQV